MKIKIFFVLLLILPFVKADIISINHGGSNEIVINSNPTQNFFFQQIIENSPEIHNQSYSNSITNGANARYLIIQSENRLVDFIMLGDSNQLKDGGGWDHAWQQSLLNEFGPRSMYGSGLISFYDNGGIGSGMGYGFNENKINFRSGGATGTLNPLPEHCNYWCANTSIDNNPVRQQFVMNLTSGAIASVSGIILSGRDNPLGYSLTSDNLLKYRLSYGVFSDQYATNNSHAQFYVLNTSATQFIASQQQFLSSENITKVNYAYYTFILQNNTLRNGSLSIDFRRQSPSATSMSSYPYYLAFQNIVRANLTTGFQGSTLYGLGSATSANLSKYIAYTNSTRIGNYIKFLTDYQIEKGLDPMAVIIINLGINDAGRSISAIEYKNNTNFTIQIIRDAWINLGYNSNNLQFLIIPTFPTQPNDSNLENYRVVSQELATTYNYVTFVNLSALTSFSELNRSTGTPRYYSLNDFNHLNQTDNNLNNSYVSLTNRIIRAIIESEHAPNVIINSPINSIYSEGNISFRISTDKPSYGKYSLDNGQTNFSMVSSQDNLSFSANRILENGNYLVNYYVEGFNHLSNLTEKVFFSVSTTASTPPTSGGSSGGGGGGGGGSSGGGNSGASSQNYIIELEYENEWSPEELGIVKIGIYDSRNISSDTPVVSLAVTDGVNQVLSRKDIGKYEAVIEIPEEYNKTTLIFTVKASYAGKIISKEGYVNIIKTTSREETIQRDIQNGIDFIYQQLTKNYLPLIGVISSLVLIFVILKLLGYKSKKIKSTSRT